MSLRLALGLTLVGITLASSAYSEEHAPGNRRAPSRNAAEAQAVAPPTPTVAPAAPTVAPPPPPPSPDRTTESFGDWSILCAAASGGPRACEVDTTIVLRGQTAPFARIGLARPAKEKPVRLLVLVPVNVSAQSPVKITVQPGKLEVELRIKSCLPNGCVAEAELSTEQTQALRAPGKTAGELTIVDASGTSVSLPMSVRGLEQGLEAYFAAQEK